MAAAYRLPRRYRYPRYRKNKAAGPVIAGVAFAVLVAATHPEAAPGAAHRAEASAGRPAAAAPVTSGSTTAFIRAVLADLGAPATTADITSLADWFPHEGTAAANNPMATTMDAPGATTFNYDGVKNYPTAAEGAEATARTLDDGRYPGIAAALKSGRGLCGDTSLAGEFLTWSGNGYSGVC
jgi:hypothetical protein